jgi:phosphomannomutase/phosphoglucomutase
MLPFAIKHLSTNLGINITASHNPKQFNGFKIFDKDGMAISYEGGLNKIKEILNREKFEEGNGFVEEKDIFEYYEKYLLEKILKLPKLKVVVDCANSVTGDINPKILRESGLDVVELYTKVDGAFPNHEPNPSNTSNLKDLIIKVGETKADFGFAYDGDGDRLGVVDKDGEIIEPIVVFSVLIKYLLNTKKKGKIVRDALTSQKIKDIIIAEGGEPIICRVGHTYIMQKMCETKADLAGELSGHYYFKETNYVDDALFATLKLIEALAYFKKPLSKFKEELPQYLSAVAEEQRVEIKNDKFKFIRELSEELKNKGYKIDTLDGVKILFPKGWALFRPCNTESKISYVYESKDRQEFEKIKKFVEEILERIKDYE